MRGKSADVLEKLHINCYWLTYIWSYRFKLELSYSNLYLPEVEMDQEYPNNNYRLVVEEFVEV